MISIIIPVYNVEKYVGDCIESILNQTYTDLEIILVNDGSTDNSGMICDEYKSKDSRIVVIHKENGGISDARNVGMDIARGDFIGFVDPDDLIHPRMYECLFNALKENNADFSSCDYISFHDGETINYNDNKVSSYTFDKLENREQYLNNFLNPNFTHHVWKSLFRQSLLKTIRFEKGKRVEDVMFCARLSSIVTKRVVIQEKLYYYRLRDTSIMHANPRVFLEHISSMEYNIRHFEEHESASFTQKYVEFVMSLILTKRIERRICGTTNPYVNKESRKAFQQLYDKYGSSQKHHLLARYLPFIYDLLKTPKVKKYLDKSI